jgi:hypothetical protein
MALRHIRITRRAAVTISAGIKYFLAKKKYYLLKETIDPRSANKSIFMNMLQANSHAARMHLFNVARAQTMEET